MSDLRVAYEAVFGHAASTVAHAPGRVNLIGEHTDYNDGFVLPMAIPQQTRVALAPTGGNDVRAVSGEISGGEIVRFELGRERPRRDWLDYVQGTVVALRAAGFPVGGFDVGIASDVPIGAGLSSSAALEVALLRALRKAFSLALDDVAIAKIGRAAETDFVGAPVGIMDQMACSLAGEGAALFIDTRSLAYERIPIPANADVVVIDSGVAHDHATGEYVTRRRECSRAAELLGVGTLRDVEDPARASALPPPYAQRARHVISENARVLAAVTCLRAGDVERLGKLLCASHASLREDFEVTVPAVDRLVAFAQRDGDCYGARMTGGGFGGAIVALAKKGKADVVAARVLEAYGAGGRVLVPRREPPP